MAGIIPWGELDAAADITTGANIDRNLSRSQRAVDDRIKALAPELVAFAPDVVAAAEAAVEDAVEGLNLVQASHGIITQSVDLDALRTVDDIGSRSVRNTYLVNGPEISGNPVVTIEVWRNAPNAVLQRATASTGDSFWRSASSDVAWGPWQKIATGDAPIISSNRDVELNEGQAVFVYDTAQVGYVMAAFPAGMTPVGANNFIANTDPSLLGGRGIRHNGGTASSIRFDATSGFTNGDVLVRGQRNQIGTSAGNAVVARMSGQAGYRARIALIGGEVRLAIGRSDASGTHTTLQSNAVSIVEGQVFYLRFNLDGSTLRARAWPEGAPEPADWLLTVDDSTLTAGAVGFIGAIHTSAWDVLSVNMSGGLAR